MRTFANFTYDINDLIKYTKKIVDSSKIAVYKKSPMKYYKLNFNSHIQAIRYLLVKIQNIETKVFTKDVVDHLADQWKDMHIGTISKKDVRDDIWDILVSEKYILFNEKVNAHINEEKKFAPVSNKITSDDGALAHYLKRLNINANEIDRTIRLLKEAYKRGLD